MKEILETIIVSLVENKDAVEIKETAEERKVTFEVKVAEGDMGRVIGRQGRLAKSIRTVMKSIADKEHKRVSLALMILGWYANEDGSAVISDLDVLENFDEYMNKVPSWLQDFFVGVFRRMDYEKSFSDYYKTNFTDNIKNQIKDAFNVYDLSDEQMKRITKLMMRRAEDMALGGGSDEK